MIVAAQNRRRFVLGSLAIGGAAAVAALDASGCLGETDAAVSSPENSRFEGKVISLPSLDELYDSSLSATSLSGEAADRVAIRRLIDAWAHCADRRLAKKQAALFTLDGAIENYQSLPQGAHEGETIYSGPPSILRGRAEIERALAVLKKFEKTTHFNGQSDVVIQGNYAIGESYCVAHQLSQEDGKRKYEILSIRYQDQFVQQNGRWLFQLRKLILDWTDTRWSEI